MRTSLRHWRLGAAALALPSAQAQTVKIAFIDPLSGRFATVGQNQLKSWQFIAEHFKQERRHGGPKFEIVSFDNKGSPAGEPERAEGRDRPGHPLRDPGQRLGRGRRHLRRGHQAQRAQPRQGGAVPQLCRGRPRADQREVQLLALPARRRHLDEDGGADQLHEGPARRQEGLPDRPELFPRPAGRASTSRRYIARKRPDVQIVGDDLHPLGADQGLRALRRQDQGLGRRHACSPATGAPT